VVLGLPAEDVACIDLGCAGFCEAEGKACVFRRCADPPE
jgi:hypothetical protein